VTAPTATTDRSPLQQSLERAAATLAIDVRIPFVLDLPCGRVEAQALIECFGRETGMLIVADMEQLGGLTRLLPDFGLDYYLWPTQADARRTDPAYWARLLRAWRWTGKGDPPDWYRAHRRPPRLAGEP
jgi:hypothetical protein